jgi:hypothetical protein
LENFPTSISNQSVIKGFIILALFTKKGHLHEFNILSEIKEKIEANQTTFEIFQYITIKNIIISKVFEKIEKMVRFDATRCSRRPQINCVRSQTSDKYGI